MAGIGCGKDTKYSDVIVETRNVRGLGDAVKRKQVLNWLKQKEAKILMLQETHSTKENEHLWWQEWGGDIIFNHGTSSARGTCILFDRDVSKKILKTVTDKEGRYIILDIEINGLRLTMGNIYGPNEDSPEFYLDVIEQIETMANDNRIIGGDYNLVLNLDLDKRGGRYATNKNSQILLHNWMEETELVDIWRFQHPDERIYTWHRLKPSKIFCRLDFFLVSYGLSEKVASSKISCGYRSDHAAASIKFIPYNSERGKGYWKLNCSLLRDSEYINSVKSVIKSVAEINGESNPNLLWDTIKMSIRGESIKYGSHRKKKTNEKIKHLEEAIQKLHEDLSTADNDLPIIEKLELRKQELNDIIKEKTQGAIVRSRIQWYEDGEANSKFFFNLEKRNANMKSINRLQLSNGSITQEPKLIMSEMTNFYKKLYTSAPIDEPDDYIRDLKAPPAIKPEHIDVLNREITEEELFSTLKEMPKNKTPGEDGLPAEFYIVFWVDIKSLLLKSYRFSFEKESLSLTQKRGVLSLLPKKSDPLQLKNWRPISLLNLDYKLIAKLLAARIKICLPYLIHDDQSGFLKGRYIGQNIVNIMDILQYTEEQDIPAIMISIDFEKAFDKLEWSFFRKSLQYFNFPEYIMKWVKILYSDIQSCIVNNGWMSDYFPLQRGVRQGCPLSPYLFIVSVELLAIHIRDNPSIKGIKIGDKTYKIKLYADDAQLFTVFESKSVSEIVFVLKKFSEISGLIINYGKTDILRIGALKNTESEIVTAQNLKWTNNNIIVLGITISTDLKNMVQINIEPLVTKMSNLIKIWSQRKLTLYGKVTIINSLLASQLIYRLSVLPNPPASTLKQIDSTLFNFLWNNKPHKIAKTLMINPRENAGIKMVDIRKKNISLKIAWVKRILDNPEFAVCPMINKYCKTDIKFLLECNLSSKDMIHCFTQLPSQFWLDVISSWCEYNYRQPSEAESPQNQILWFNSNIKINDRVLWTKELYEKNVIYIKDLHNQNGKFYSYIDFQNIYNTKITFLHYYGILHAIPSIYKQNASKEAKQQSNINKILATEKVAKFVYRELVLSNSCFPEKAYEKLKEMLSSDFSRETYLAAFLSLHRCTQSTKLRDFQFRLLHNALVTNVSLKKWGIRENDNCTFCNTTRETSHHIMLTCKYSQEIWEYVDNILFEHLGHRIHFSTCDLFLGVMGTPLDNLYNHINLIVKQYLYACRCLGKIPCKNVLAEKIKEARYIEMSIATQHNRMEAFLRKWQMLDFR